MSEDSSEQIQGFSLTELKNGIFNPKSIEGFVSMNDGEFYTTLQGNKILKFSYQTGEQVATLFDGFDLPTLNGYQISPDETKILLKTQVKKIFRHSSSATYIIFDLITQERWNLSEQQNQQNASFSSDSKYVDFVSENNIFVVNLETRKEIQITKDGQRNYIINGIPDWVYEEEFGFSRAVSWSKNKSVLSFIRFDESKVKEYSFHCSYNQTYPEEFRYKYPKAGENNSIVQVWIYDIENNEQIEVDIGEEIDQYIPRIGFTPIGDLYIFRLNRAQNHFEILLSDSKKDNKISTKRIFEEIDESYIDYINDDKVTFLEDGDRFIVKLIKEGFYHLSVYSISKGFLNQITSGNWNVTNIIGIENEKNLLYFYRSFTN